MNLSIIVVNWNTHDLLAQCLQSVYNTVHSLEFEVFVVDNASADGSAAMVRQRFPQVRLIENEENVGFARANNQAIRRSTGRYVLLLNSDTMVLPNALLRMVRYMETHSQVGLLGANLLNRNWSPQTCYGPLPTLYHESLAALGLDRRWLFTASSSALYVRKDEPEDDYLDTGWVLGATMLTRREAIETAGLLDEGYFMFSEEIDWADRIARVGWRVGYLRSAAIVHLRRASSRQAPNRMLPQLYRSKLRYFRQRGHRVGLVFLRAAVCLSAAAKFVVAGISSLWSSHGRREVRIWSEVLQVATESLPND